MGSGTATSGTALVGHHETSWYRIIGTTHFDDPTTQSIEGYAMRTNGPNSANPCLTATVMRPNTGTRNGTDHHPDNLYRLGAVRSCG